MSDDLKDEYPARRVSPQNEESIREERQRAAEELLKAKCELELKTDELAQSLAMAQATLESTTDGILVTDGEAIITDFNRKFLHMWGLSDPTLVGQSHKELIERTRQILEDSEKFVGDISEIYEKAPSETFHLLKTRDKRFIERSSRIQVVRGKSVGRVWSFRDVTKQMQIEEALRDETKILELLEATGRAVVSTLDLQKLVQAVTDAGTELCGAQFGAFFYSSKDEHGKLLQLYTISGAPREAFAKFGQPRATALFGPTFEGSAPIRSDDIHEDPRYGKNAPHYGMPKGHLPVRSYLATPVMARGGEVLGALFFGHAERAVFTERSQRLVVGLAAQAAVAIDNARLYQEVKEAAERHEKLLEAERFARAEAERVNVMKDEFLATISHELRTPLNVIVGWADILASGSYDPDELQQGLATIMRNARAQTKLIEDLLDLSRIISGHMRLESGHVDLLEIIDSAIASVKPSTENKGISLRKVSEMQKCVVVGDPSRLQQIIWNLLTNAIKFTPRGGFVEIGLKLVDSDVEVTVADSGIGINPDFLPHVFERFRQADSSSTRAHGGLGIGLAIVKQLAEIHGGSVSVKSSGAGHGASFVLRLPVPHHETEPQVAGADSFPSEVEDTIYLKGLRVLVVDDEPDARVLIERVLQRHNTFVVTAEDADEALALIRVYLPDVLISDIGMPQKDGYHLIREVRKLPASEGGKTPAIALTAFARSEDRASALLAGYQMYLTKPIESSELLATVASLAKSMETMPP